MPVVTGAPQAELKITPEGARRFFVGLSWNPPAAVGTRIKVAGGPGKGVVEKTAHGLFAPLEFVRVGVLATSNLIMQAISDAKRSKDDDAKGRDKKSEAYDLDLDCYIFDKDGGFIRVVGTEDAAYIDPSKKIYHTGDDQTGGGGPDDEQVYVETRGLPPEYAQLYFVVKCDSKFDFSQYDSPRVRIADSKQGESQLECRLGPADTGDDAGKGKYNYVFCRVLREAGTGPADEAGQEGDRWYVTAIDAYLDEGVDWQQALPQLTAA